MILKTSKLQTLKFILILLFVSLTANAKASENVLLYPNQPADKAGRRPKVALVLGGGGAKGAAEVGVLKYIEKSGIPIDMVVGTSIGSIVGGLYSMGYRSEQLDSLFRSQEWLSLLTDRSLEHSSKLIEKENGVTYVLGYPVNLNFKKKKREDTNDNALSQEGQKQKKRFQLGALKGDSIVSTLQRMIGTADSLDFNEMPIPYRCVAVDLNSFEEVVISSGNLAEAMRASMAIPLAFRPMVIDDRTLVDGGVMNNLPVDVAKAMGADIVIAVDLTVNKHKGEKNGADFDEEFDNMFAPLKKLGLLNMLKWSLARPDMSKYQSNVRNADIYINPDLKGFSVSDFSPVKIDEMIKRGEEAGKKSLKTMKKLNKKIR